MADLEARIRHTLHLVREALTAIEADPDVLREAVERVQKVARDAHLAIPKETPPECLREIERILVRALDHLEG